MARAKPQVTEDVSKPEPVSKTISVIKNGEVVRIYSFEGHGKDFKNLAEAYAKKIKGTIR